MYLDLCRTTLDKLIDLRHEILRHGLPRDAAVFAGDETPDARHYGAFEAGSIVGCATLHPSTWEAEPAWQLAAWLLPPTELAGGWAESCWNFLNPTLHRQKPRPGYSGATPASPPPASTSGRVGRYALRCSTSRPPDRMCE